MIEAHCKACGETFTAPDSLNGCRKSCPACGKPVMIIAKKVTESPPAAPSPSDHAEVPGPRKRYEQPKLWAQSRRARRIGAAIRLLVHVVIATVFIYLLGWRGFYLGNRWLVFFGAVYACSFLIDIGSHRHRLPTPRPRSRQLRRIVTATRIIGSVAGVAFIINCPKLYDDQWWPMLFAFMGMLLVGDLIRHRCRFGDGIPAAVVVIPFTGLFMALCPWVLESRYEYALDGADDVRVVQFPTTRAGAWDGFEDLKWGAHVDHIAGLELDHRDEPSHITAYTRPGEKLVIGDGEISITYSFCRGAFFSFELDCSGRSTAKRFREAIIARYGPVDCAPGSVDAWSMWGGRSSDGGWVMVEALFLPTRTSVRVTYMSLRDESERDQQRAASDSRPTTGESR